jgi:hypothetical protein
MSRAEAIGKSEETGPKSHSISSEADTGSRQENASNKKQSPALIPSKPE